MAGECCMRWVKARHYIPEHFNPNVKEAVENLKAQEDTII